MHEWQRIGGRHNVKTDPARVEGDGEREEPTAVVLGHGEPSEFGHIDSRRELHAQATVDGNSNETAAL
jgi:hypothetical protein